METTTEGNLLQGKASARMMGVWEDSMDGELGMHGMLLTAPVVCGSHDEHAMYTLPQFQDEGKV